MLLPMHGSMQLTTGKVCANSWCKAAFEVSDADLIALDTLSPIIAGRKYSLPPPTRCVRCRHQQRAMFSEGMTFFRRTCDRTGVPILSIFNPEKSFPVFAIEAWWKDDWDALAYGMDVDVQQPFFAQFQMLCNVVPKMAVFNEGCENSDFCSSSSTVKNCYYCRTAHRGENLYYSDSVTGYNADCSDCLRCQRCELLLEGVECFGCHSSSYLFRCNDLVESHFCMSCRNCKQCLFCNNLVNKEYHIENQPVGKEEFNRTLRTLFDGTYSTLQKNIARWHQVMQRTIRPALQHVNSDGCTGDALYNCHNAHDCFMCFNVVDSRHCWDLTPSETCTDSMDLTKGGIGELLYNSSGLGGGNYQVLCSNKCRRCAHLLYCSDCYSSKHCFGCTGLKQKEYCIFNKQYSQKAYEDLVSRIIEHMQRTGEWGSWFPSVCSSFAYNHSSAMYHFRLTKEEVHDRGWWWSDYAMHAEAKRTIPAASLPNDIADIPDDVLQWAITCEKTGQPFKLIRQELAMYRARKLPLPHEHPDVRMERRRKMLNPYQLFPRTCAKCTKAIETSYPPVSKAIVYCEECYLKTVY